MKKFLAVVLSMMMVLSVTFGTAVVAFAAPTIASQETTKKVVKPSVTVNGNASSDVEIEVDENDPNKIVFNYNGDGNLTGWNFYDADGNLLVEGVDYDVVYDGNTATVTVLSEIDVIVADAIVEDEENPEEPEEPTETTKPNKGNESPATGAMGLAGLAVAGAGVAILTAVKRKADAE